MFTLFFERRARVRVRSRHLLAGVSCKSGFFLLRLASPFLVRRDQLLFVGGMGRRVMMKIWMNDSGEEKQVVFCLISPPLTFFRVEARNLARFLDDFCCDHCDPFSGAPQFFSMKSRLVPVVASGATRCMGRLGGCRVIQLFCAPCLFDVFFIFVAGGYLFPWPKNPSASVTRFLFF